MITTASNVPDGAALDRITSPRSGRRAGVAEERPDRPGLSGGRTPVRDGYGPARLRLGISAVGTWVVVAAVALALDLPSLVGGDGAVAELLGGVACVAIVALIQLPFDVFGGRLLPRRHGRAHPSWGRFLGALARGVAVHSAMLLAVGVVLLTAGRVGGQVAVWLAGVLVSVELLGLRSALARAMARLPVVRGTTAVGLDARVPTVVVESEDEGFTGGVDGAFTPRASILPARWGSVLGSAGLELAVRRREEAVHSGAWRRGRWIALLFVWAGIALASGLVGGEELGRASGIVRMSLLFTLWSFLGLLVLPTVSRRAVRSIDAALLADGVDGPRLRSTIARLDALQDDEPVRSPLVQAIFHPVPDAAARAAREAPGDVEDRRVLRSPGGWDAARTAVYLGASGLGLLGRAVHCNCGRPALWAYLPTE